MSQKQKNARVSVIVPVRNEEAHIGQTLEYLFEQDCEGIEVEIFVVDGRSTDRTREIVEQLAKSHPHLQLLDNPKQLSSGARNVGIEHSSGEYVVIIDGHCEIPSRTYFRDLVDAFERTGADCLGRPQPLDVTQATTFQKAVAAARNSPLGHHPDSFIYSKEEVACPAISVAIAYRRSVFERVGLFDSNFDACEDCELNHRIDQAGLNCYLVPKLTVLYQPRKSLGGLFRQLMRYGRGRVRLARKHSERLSSSAILLAMFWAGVILGPLVCWLVPVLWYFYLGIVLIYLAVVCYFSVKAAMNSANVRLALWLPAIFVTIHAGSAWGVLYELALGLFSSSSKTSQTKPANLPSGEKFP